MISIIGIGNGASAIAEKFKDTPQYNFYKEMHEKQTLEHVLNMKKL